MEGRPVAHYKLSGVSSSSIPGRGAGTEARARVEGSSPKDSGLTVLTRKKSAAIDVVVIEEAVKAGAEDDHVF